jgi:DNA-binding HxlR family transcriptional regulator
MRDYAVFFKVLSDDSRLKIIASLYKEPMYVERLSNRLDLHPSTVSFHLKKLQENELVFSKKEQYYTMYYLHESAFDVHLLDILKKISTVSPTEEEREAAYNQKIIDTFFEAGQLKSIPVQRKKRLVILKKIAEDFEMNKPYKEVDVNHMISQYHFDFCTIRREFIMNKLFIRDKGIYTRIK